MKNHSQRQNFMGSSRDAPTLIIDGETDIHDVWNMQTSDWKQNVIAVLASCRYPRPYLSDSKHPLYAARPLKI